MQRPDDDSLHLRERLAEHIWKFGWNVCEFDGESGTKEHCDHLAGLALEALGLRPVARFKENPLGMGADWLIDPDDDDEGLDDGDLFYVIRGADIGRSEQVPGSEADDAGAHA